MNRSFMILLMALTVAAMAASATEPVTAHNVSPVQILKPNGGEVLYEEQAVQITWKASGIAPESAQIMLSTDGGKSYSATIADLKFAVNPNQDIRPDNKVERTWTWKHPYPLSESLRLKVVVYAQDKSKYDDESDRTFTLKTLDPEAVQMQPAANPAQVEPQRADVRVVYPNGGEKIIAHIPMDIRWMTFGERADMTEIRLSTDGGKSYPTILASLRNPRDPIIDSQVGPMEQWTWHDPTPAGDQMKIKVTLYTALDVVRSDESDGTFSIEDGGPSSVIMPTPEVYPNPFNPIATIGFELKATAPVELKVYDMQGRLVTTLVNETLPAGSHTATFDGSALASGTYIYRLSAGEQTMQNTMRLIK